MLGTFDGLLEPRGDGGRLAKPLILRAEDVAFLGRVLGEVWIIVTTTLRAEPAVTGIAFLMNPSHHRVSRVGS